MPDFSKAAKHNTNAPVKNTKTTDEVADAITTPPTTALAKAAPTVDEVMAALAIAPSRSDEGHTEEGDVPSGGVPWIGYRTNKSKSRIDELNAAGIGENQFYLHDNAMIGPKPFAGHLMYSYHFYSKVDSGNKIIGYSPVLTQVLKDQGYSDHLIGVMLVRLPGDKPLFTAATFSQRKAMVRAFDKAIAELKLLTADPNGTDFKAKGKAFAEAFTTAKWKQFAVRTKVWGKLEPHSDPSKDAYNKGIGSVEPTPVGDIEALNRYAGLTPESYPGENKKDGAWADAVRSFISRRNEAVAAIAKVVGK